jgi:hypothetical protein
MKRTVDNNQTGVVTLGPLGLGPDREAALGRLTGIGRCELRIIAISPVALGTSRKRLASRAEFESIGAKTAAGDRSIGRPDPSKGQWRALACRRSPQIKNGTIAELELGCPTRHPPGVVGEIVVNGDAVGGVVTDIHDQIAIAVGQPVHVLSGHIAVESNGARSTIQAHARAAVAFDVLNRVRPADARVVGKVEMNRHVGDGLGLAGPAPSSAIGMLRYAIEFYAAALAADRAIGDMGGYEITAPTPLNYLIGHAIELGLKPTIKAKRCDGPGRNAKQ